MLQWLNQERVVERYTGLRGHDGSEVAGAFERWLGKNTAASRTRIRDLIAAIQRISALTIAVADQLVASHQPMDKILFQPPRKLAASLNDIDTRLAEYPTVASVDIDSDYRTVYLQESSAVSKRPEGECIAANGVIKLTNLGLLERFGQCDCGRYFFGRVPNQSFCSVKCRRKHHESSEEFKAARRAYMRRYYKLKTSGKVR